MHHKVLIKNSETIPSKIITLSRIGLKSIMYGFKDISLFKNRNLYFPFQ